MHDFSKYLCPIAQVLFSLARQRVHTACGPGVIGVPIRGDVAVCFQTSQRPIQRGSLDFRIGKRVVGQIAGKLVTVGTAFRVEHEQQYRLDEPIQMPHRASAWILVLVPKAPGNRLSALGLGVAFLCVSDGRHRGNQLLGGNCT